MATYQFICRHANLVGYALNSVIYHSMICHFNFIKNVKHLPLYIWLAICLGLSAPVFGQTNGELAAPSFSVETLTNSKEALQDNGNLTPEQITNATQSYDVAIAALENAASALETAARFRGELEGSPRTIDRLQDQIARVQAARANDPALDNNAMTGETLLKLEQDLISKESELRTLRGEVEGHETSLQTILQRPVRDELSEARSRQAELSTDLESLGTGELDTQGRARKAALEARQYYRRAQVQALELEIASSSPRQQITSLRRDLALLKAQRAEQEVIFLQSQTGQRRLTEAETIHDDAEVMLSALENAHPFLIDYASENFEVSSKLMEIAVEARNSPMEQASARSRRDAVKNDLDVAQSLTQLGRINRQSSATLRRLRNQRPSVNAVKAERQATRNAIITATQDRLWAQEQLRLSPLGQFDVEGLMKDWLAGNPGQIISATDAHILKALYTNRRALLLEISDAAYSRISEAEDLQTLETELLTHTTELRDLLDQKLLWLPSVTAINTSWPDKALRGTFQVFNVENLNRINRVLGPQIARFWLIIILACVIVTALLLMRRSLRTEIDTVAKKVGRVQKDSYWHTPKVIIACSLIAAPIPLLLLLTGLLFASSGSPDTFIQALGQTGIELSGFMWFFLTWKEWNRDRSLMGAHYKLPAIIRKSVNKQLAWFIPVAGVMITLVTLTQNSREPDIYEGFSLLAFIIVSGILSVFGFKVLWAKRTAFEQAFTDLSFLWRYRQLFTVLVVGLPIVAGLLAAAGYYDTARELLSRLFFSGGLMIGSYVAYNLIRRTVVIAQRRLALRQAIERRELSLKARQEKEEAEERGDPPPPPVNYDEIDLETISRQSLQLLNTFVLLGFAIMMWVFWQDLLPALSVFDEVVLWPHTVKDAEGILTTENVSLWNAIQALATVVLTIIAAKNLPGFLEVFILSRSKFDAGTRYAIVSVLGYVIVAIGIVIAFNRLGTEWSQLQWIAAALSLGIGFGLQEIIANFVSGLIILFERPVRLGDYVTIGDQSGTITRIQIRATTLSDLDHREILIPNKALITERVTNWTLSNSVTRMIIKVGVAYGTDTDKARDIIFDAVSHNTKVLEAPKPQVLFLGFGDSSLDFEIRIFLRSFEDRFPVSHSIHTDVNKALEKAGISIPFPQRDLHIISQPDAKA